MTDVGLYRLFTPRSLGGYEVEPIVGFEVVERLATIDSAAAWNLVLHLQASGVQARMPASFTNDVFGPSPDAPMATVANAGMAAVEVEGGYRLDGRWPTTSGSQHAEWVLGAAPIMAGDQPRMVDGNPVLILAGVPRADFSVDDTWHTMGMRGTGSNDVVIEDAFVPSSRAWIFQPMAGTNEVCRGPLYRTPIIGLVATLQSAVPLGIARTAVDHVKNVAQGKVPELLSTTLRERPVAQMRIAQAEGLIRSARAYVAAACHEVWEETSNDRDGGLERRADLTLVAAHSVQAARDAVRLVASIAGMEAAREGLLTRAVRDVEVLAQHAYSSEARFETVGRVYLGLPPDFPFVAA